MIYKVKELEEIKVAILATPHPYIMLQNSGGQSITNFNAQGKQKIKHFEENILPYLQSEASPPGTYSIYGRNAGKALPLKILDIEKEAKPGQQIPAIMPTIINDKNQPSISLIEKNAELKFQNQYLEEEISRLKIIINDLNSELLEKEEQIEDFEKPVPGTLSESQTMLLNLAAPLIPTITTLAEYYLKKLIPSENQNLNRIFEDQQPLKTAYEPTREQQIEI